MLANDTSDVVIAAAYAIGALALLALATGVLVALVKQHKVTATIDSKLGHIDVAVNGVKHTNDDPPLVEKVRRIERTLKHICEHLGLPPLHDGNGLVVGD